MRHWLKLPDRCLHEHVGSYARGGSVQFNSSRDVVTHRTPRLLVVRFGSRGSGRFSCHSEEEDNLRLRALRCRRACGVEPRKILY